MKRAVCLLLAIVAGIWAQTDERRDSNSQPHDLLLADHLHGQWLTIGRVNHKEPAGEFNPNWTYILCMDGIIPVIKKHGNHYQITFTTELTKDLP
jgi:hypothetical protein